MLMRAFEVPADPQVARGMVMSARFDTGAGAWATPVPLNTDSSQPRVASDATGAVLAVYGDRSNVIRGCFFDPVSGTWQPEALIEQNHTGTGFSFGPLPLLDGSGNALVAYHNARTGPGILARNYFSRSGGGWGQLPPEDPDILGVMPGTLTEGGQGNPELVNTLNGNFLLAWTQAESELDPQGPRRIVIARFTSNVRTWSAAQTLIPGSATKNIQLQRMATDAGGNEQLLWTENDGMRTALKAVRLDPAGAACSLVETIDRAVGGGAARADLGVDPRGRRHGDLAAIRRGASRRWLTQQHRDQPLRPHCQRLGKRGVRRDATWRCAQSSHKRQRRPGAARVDSV
jgi:hypothetical protein